jgi:hypothetical protein
LPVSPTYTISSSFMWKEGGGEVSSKER